MSTFLTLSNFTVLVGDNFLFFPLNSSVQLHSKFKLFYLLYHSVHFHFRYHLDTLFVPFVGFFRVTFSLSFHYFQTSTKLYKFHLQDTSFIYDDCRKSMLLKFLVQGSMCTCMYFSSGEIDCSSSQCFYFPCS